MTHMVRHATPFVDKGEQCFITLGLKADPPIDALFALGFQQDAKMTIDFAIKRAEPAFLQKQFAVTFKELTFKEPWRTKPESMSSQGNCMPKLLLTTNK
jgi:hypothetical protein